MSLSKFSRPATSEKKTRSRKTAKKTYSYVAIPKEVMAVFKSCPLAEYKSPPRLFRSGSPADLHCLDHLEYQPTHNETSTAMRETVRSLFGQKVYGFRISGVFSMSASGGGIVNSVITAASLGGLADFGTLSTVFNEYFILKYVVSWQPNSWANGPVGFLPASTVSSLPIVVAQLQHNQSAFSTASQASNSPGSKISNTGIPFRHTWMNSEDPDRGIMTEIQTSGAPTQSWNQYSNSASYTGQLQFISATTPTLPVSAGLGQFKVDYYMLTRCRV